MKMFVAAVVLVSSSSCKVEKKQVNENLQPEQKRQQFFNGNLAESDRLGRYKIQDESCQNGQGLEKFSEFEALIWDGSKTISKLIPANLYNSVNVLKSSSIQFTAYGYSDEATCDFKNNSLDCNDKQITRIARAKELKICQNKIPHTRESAEGVAITSSYHLDNAWDFYQNLPNKLDSFKPANLMIFPRHQQKFSIIKDEVENIGTYTVADNLAFHPKYQGLNYQPTFIIYPTSDQLVPKDSSRPHLWESPWGLSHEFGHYILFKHAKIEQLSSLSSQIKNLFLQPIKHKHLEENKINNQSQLISANNTSRELSAIEHWRAINEGFSDMIAFYAQGGKESTAVGLTCLEVNRDILSATFADQKSKKVLNENVLNLFQSKTFSNADNCLNPNFQSIHTIGSIVAYGLNQLFILKDKSATTKQLGTMTLDWADQLGIILNNNFQANNNVKITFTIKDLILAGVKVASVNNTLNKDQCRSLNENFPVYASDWINSGNIVCEN